MLKIIDNMIPYEKTSERFFIELRIFSAWKNKNIKTIKRLCKIICEETKEISFQNLHNLKGIVTIFHSILIHESLKFWGYVIKKLICLEYMYQII